MTHGCLVNHSQVGEAVKEAEKIDNPYNEREPSTRGAPGDKSLPEVDEAANPEELAGDEDHDDAEEKQIEKAPILTGVYQPERTISEEQPENEDAPVCSMESNDVCHLHAGKLPRLNYHEFPFFCFEEAATFGALLRGQRTSRIVFSVCSWHETSLNMEHR